MLRIILGLSLIFTLSSLSAQHETLFSNLDVTGAFGSVLIEGGDINGEIGADVGGGGALVMSPLFIGAYGMGTKYPVHTVPEGSDIEAGDYDLKFGHGGLWLGYAPKSDKLLHFYSSAKIGWGKTRLREDKKNVVIDRHFVMLPEIGFEINLTEYMKMSFTGGYRFVNGITQIPGLENEDLSSPVGLISFRIGGFTDDF